MPQTLQVSLRNQLKDTERQLDAVRKKNTDLNASVGRLTNHLEALQRENRELQESLEHKDRALADSQMRNRDLIYENIQQRQQVEWLMSGRGVKKGNEGERG